MMKNLITDIHPLPPKIVLILSGIAIFISTIVLKGVALKSPPDIYLLPISLFGLTLLIGTAITILQYAHYRRISTSRTLGMFAVVVLSGFIFGALSSFLLTSNIWMVIAVICGVILLLPTRRSINHMKNQV